MCIIRDNGIISSVMKKIKLGLDSDSVTGRNGVLGVPRKKNFLRPPWEEGVSCKALL